MADVPSRPTITPDTFSASSTGPYISGRCGAVRPGHRPTRAMKTARPYPGDLHDVWCELRHSRRLTWPRTARCISARLGFTTASRGIPQWGRMPVCTSNGMGQGIGCPVWVSASPTGPTGPSHGNGSAAPCHPTVRCQRSHVIASRPPHRRCISEAGHPGGASSMPMAATMIGKQVAVHRPIGELGSPSHPMSGVRPLPRWFPWGRASDIVPIRMAATDAMTTRHGWSRRPYRIGGPHSVGWPPLHVTCISLSKTHQTSDPTDTMIPHVKSAEIGFSNFFLGANEQRK